MNWFGTSWGAPLNTDTPQCETPVGARCLRDCGRLIEAGDQGVTMPYSGVDGESRAAYHLPCFLKTVTDHRMWPASGLVPGVTDGFEPTGNGTDVRCPHCGMTYSLSEGRWR